MKEAANPPPVPVSGRRPPWPIVEVARMESVLAIALVAVFALNAGCSRYRDVAKLDLGDDFVCKVRIADELEPTDPCFYIITKASKVVVPLTYIAGYSEGSVPTFTILSSDDRQYIGLVTKERPSDILMLFDKHTLESWPRAGDRELPSEVALRGDRLLASLIAGAKRRDLKLRQ